MYRFIGGVILLFVSSDWLWVCSYNSLLQQTHIILDNDIIMLASCSFIHNWWFGIKTLILDWIYIFNGPVSLCINSTYGNINKKTGCTVVVSRRMFGAFY